MHAEMITKTRSPAEPAAEFKSGHVRGQQILSGPLVYFR
jgi:hypothetical protein